MRVNAQPPVVEPLAPDIAVNDRELLRDLAAVGAHVHKRAQLSGRGFLLSILRGTFVQPQVYAGREVCPLSGGYRLMLSVTEVGMY